MLTESRPQFRFPDYRDWRRRRSGEERWLWPLALQVDFPPANIWSSADGRTIPIPEGLDIDKASASLKNGMVTITIPKREGAEGSPKRISVNEGRK